MRYFILNLILLVCLLPVGANQFPLCAYIYYAEEEANYVDDIFITRVREIQVSDFFSTEYNTELTDTNPYSDIFDAQNTSMYTSYKEDESLGGDYGFYLNAAYTGAAGTGDLFFADHIKHLTHRLVNNHFIGHAAAAWSGDGRMAYAWNQDDNHNEEADDHTVYLATYHPLSEYLQTNSFINTVPNAPLTILGWSGDKRYFALLEYEFYEPYDDWQNVSWRTSSRIQIISAEDLQVVELQVEGTLTADSFVWSPNGAQFAYTLGNQIIVGTVSENDHRYFQFDENESYAASLYPEWSADGHYLAISKADADYNWSHLLLEPSTGRSVHLAANGLDIAYSELESNRYRGARYSLGWSADSSRWMYPASQDAESYQWLAYDISTETSLILAENIAYPQTIGFYNDDGIDLYYGELPGFVGQKEVFAVLSPMNHSYQVSLIRDDGQTTTLLENANVVDMAWTADQKKLLVVTAVGVSEAGTLRMTVYWFNREGVLEGSYESEIIRIGATISEPYSAQLLLTLDSLKFQAILINFESSRVISLVQEDESEGSPYGYWNATWWIDFPSVNYVTLGFEQPFPIYSYGDYARRSDGTALENNLSEGRWSDDASLVLVPEYHWIGENSYDQDLESMTLRIVEPDGRTLWEENIPAGEYPVDWFWGRCDMYEDTSDDNEKGA